MKCPLKNCGAVFRESDVRKDNIYDTLHGRHIGNNWLSEVKCPSCEGAFIVRQVVSLEVFGYDEKPQRRDNDTIQEVS